MEWLELILACAVSVGLLVLPGLPAAAAAGLRGLWLVGAAVPLSATVVSVAAAGSPRVGLTWSWIPVVAVAGAVAAVMGICRWLLRRWWTLNHEQRFGRAEVFAAAVALLAGTVLVGRILWILPRPSSFSLTYDVLFHYNGIRWILETGDASPGSLPDMVGSSSGFYPMTYHAMASLTAQLTGTEPVVAGNAMWLAVLLLWPIGAILLARAAVGSSRPVVVGAAAFSVALPAFPLRLVEHGATYPVLMAFVMLATVLALSLRALGLSLEDRAPSTLSLPHVAVLGVALMGMAVTHPSAITSWLVLTGPWVLVAAWRFARRATALSRRLAWGAAALAWLVVVLVISQYLRPSDAGTSMSSATMSPRQAVVEWLTLTSSGWPYIPWLAVIVVWIGVVGVVLTRRFTLDQRLLLLSGPLVVGALCVVASASWNTDLRSLMVQPWYADSPRIAAMLPIVVGPLAAFGIASCWQFLRHRGSRWLSSPGRVVLVGAVGAVAISVGFQSSDSLNERFRTVQTSLTPSEHRYVSDDELRLLERVATHVPEDAVIAGQPWAGGSFAYMLSGRHVLYPHFRITMTPDIALLTEKLRDARAGDEVCAAAKRLRVEYAFDFQFHDDLPLNMPAMPGLADIDQSAAFELVDHEGDVGLYRLIACDADGS